MMTKEPEDVIPVRILGARGSGKTTFLYKSYFKYGTGQPDTHFTVIPTPTHNVEMIPYQSRLFELWDFAGNPCLVSNQQTDVFIEISSCLNHLNEHTRVLVYMVDAIENQKEAVAFKSRENMIWLLENFGQALEHTIIITVVNKQPDINHLQEIGNAWAHDKPLMGLLKGHDWRIFGCDALTGDGLDAIFQYMHQTLAYHSRHGLMSNSVSQQPSTITPWESLLNPYHLSDQEFKSGFFSSQKAFLFFDHGCLVRIIFLTLSEHKMSSLFQQLHHVITHIDQENRSIMYSETQILFWIQMVSFALLKSPLLEGEENDFESFSKRCQLEQDCWKHYYTQRLFYSEKAAKVFLPPDKKPLPNAFKPSSLALKGSGLRIDYQVL
ncbi:P-loop containing nucleoside triphosphate hydrolase protein [Gilbertella persicaria]|uniref:P-loop containing nucleoside triphosphate hydrolase protein n=1 Tax=Gilbertella persicaria TaxID=101096 RepID=UPI00221EB7EE|nr:P-loop containing nucleoside triphosphate hydrolase protein [Gilbertella persicaria]KAI8083990.1 P-loop containing nucleoside triphosphate hydrolase protein [Gilbertella persicaria]